jgi:hypothetical protein
MKIQLILLLMAGFALEGNAQLQWPNGAKAAVCLTYDDALDGHLDVAIPQLDAAGLKGTFFCTGNSPTLYSRMEEWRKAASNGHELGNHTLFHPYHGANRLGASALMQGLADGYFIIPNTIGDYLARSKPATMDPDHSAVRATESEVRERTARLLGVHGSRPVDAFHRELGKVMWDGCGMARSAGGLRGALERIPALREEFWRTVRVGGAGEEFNQALERAGRVADYLEFAELMCVDALHREESCGGHFRVEHQTAEGEAQRDDENFTYAAAWEYAGDDRAPVLHREPLVFETVQLATRSYA